MFEDLKNNIDFYIREKTRFTRSNFVEKNEKILMRNYLENLYVYDVLEKYIEKQTRDNIRVLDIGCKNWFYARGVYSYFTSFCKSIEMNGVEIDAHRLYSNFYSRIETAKFYTRGLKNTNYISGDLLDIEQKYDYITWFLPFVTLKPLRYWGLPRRFFIPEKLMSHAFSLLNDGGQMLIINQGEYESKVQVDILEKLKIKYQTLGEITSEFYKYQNKRYGYLICKPN